MTINERVSDERLSVILSEYTKPAYTRFNCMDTEVAAMARELQQYRAAAEPVCPKCRGTGMADSGGTQPWGEPIEIECDCRQQDSNTAELVAAGIITKVGE